MTAPSVLIIDDEPAVREAVAQNLRRETYQLRFANNGEEGLKLMREAAPTVIILDLRMPVMDGLEFLAHIDLKPADPYAVVVLTGHGDTEAMRQCYDAGVSIFLKKPFNLYEIRGAVKNAITVKLLTNHLDHLVKERTAELEQRMREIAALNQMFQDRINQQLTVDSEYEALLGEFLDLAQRINDLSQRAQILTANPIKGPSNSTLE